MITGLHPSNCTTLKAGNVKQVAVTSSLQPEPLVASLLLVAMPFAASSFLLLVAMPGAPSSVLLPDCNALPS